MQNLINSIAFDIVGLGFVGAGIYLIVAGTIASKAEMVAAGSGLTTTGGVYLGLKAPATVAQVQAAVAKKPVINTTATPVTATTVSSTQAPQV